MSISISGSGAITGATTSYSFDQSVSVGGTVTYEDVTNVDSIGIITARSGIEVTGGNIHIAGVGATIGVATAYIGSINDLNYPTAGPLSNRNLIINGGMTVCQRFAVNTANNINNATHTYHVDRFKAYNDNTGILQGEWVNTEFPEGFKYSLKYTPATAVDPLLSGNLSFISYVIEEKDFERFRWGTANAQTLTLSFKVKTNKAGTYCVSFFNANTFDRSYIVEVPITDTSNWNDVTITVPGDTSGTWSMMRINWSLAIAANEAIGTPNTWQSSPLYATSNQVNFMDNTSNEFYITGVQLEVGSKSTPFEHESYGQTLAKCQRYCVQLDFPSTVYVAQGGLQNTSSIRGAMIHLPVSMRTRALQANVTFSGTGNSAGNLTFLKPNTDYSTVGTLTGEGNSTSTVHVYGDGFTSIGSIGQTSQLYAHNGSWIRVDVEL